MAARRRPKKQDGPTVATTSTTTTRNNAATASNSPQNKSQTNPTSQPQAHRSKLDRRQPMTPLQEEKLRQVHLVPLPLVLVVMVCSGFMWILAFRDVMSTGRSILGPTDDAYLQFTKSTAWFDISKGYIKSKAGGFSTIAPVTTDANNMGGLFVRKLSGAAGLAFHSQKLVPLLFQPEEAHFGVGHFYPVLMTAVIGNLCIVAFHGKYLKELQAAGAGTMGMAILGVSLFEAFVMFAYVVTSMRRAATAKKLYTKFCYSPTNASSSAITKKKNPNAIVCNIVMRTVSIVSGMITLIFGRDLFFPGTILEFIPRDDIYLEWTNALVHSPPPYTPESTAHALESPLYIGDKYVSQLLALYMLLGCAYKFVTAFWIRYGEDGRSGEVQCRLIWKCQSVGNGLMVFVFRLFAAAAKSASLDLRWHLMMLTYETFILGLYAYF